MQKLIIIITLIPLLSCGIKKDLVSTQQDNIELQKKISEMESEQKRLELQRDRLYNQNQDYRRRIAKLLREQELQKNYSIEREGYRIGDDDVAVPPAPKVEKIFSVVEQMPQFPGGETKLYEFISKKMKYPSQAKESGVQGKVYVQFVVNTKGEITNAKVIRGIGSGCDQEALRIVKMMPKWKPGIQRGKPVNVKFILPFNFSLR
mgnify:CR=1 FL=1